MRPLRLGAIRLNGRSHLSALWWLGLLYRKPTRFYKAVKRLPRWRALAAALRLYLHAVPSMVLIAVLGRLLLHGALALPTTFEAPSSGEVLGRHAAEIAIGIAGGIAVVVGSVIVIVILLAIVVGVALVMASGIAIEIALEMAHAIAFGIAFGIASGIASGIVFGMADGIAGGIAIGIAGGIAGGIATGIAPGIAGGIAFGIVVAIALGIAAGIAGGIAAGIAAGIATGIATGIAGGIAAGIAFGIGYFRAFYFLVHIPMVWPRVRARWYRLHPVAWDDRCPLPFPGLDRLLVAYAEAFPAAGEREIRRLIDTYPAQRGSALRARTILRVRQSGRVKTLVELPMVLALLPEGEKGYLAQTSQARDMVAEIARLQARLDTLSRPVFREPLVRALVGEIRGFSEQIAGFHEPLASEFRTAAALWLKLAQRQLDEALAVLGKRQAPQVFRAGDPVDRAQEAFVERSEAVGELERQVMLATGCPGILLYGRRRTGKSTLLKNLGAFVPTSVRLASISLQNPQAFTSLESLLRTLARECRAVLAGADSGLAEPADLPGLFAWLEGVNGALDRRGERLVLALDEYEQIDAKIGEGVFGLDLLATLRESIQKHRRVTWVLAGSHHVAELGHAPWPSFLASVRTVEVLPFALEETRLLLTDPLRHSPLWTRSGPPRPRFDPAFWGEGGIERIHAEAAGWPHLVQLLAETAVDLVNDSAATRLDAAMMERSLDRAVVGGDNVLRLLMQIESVLPGEWDYLCGFRRSDTQPPPAEEALFVSLRRRLVVEDAGAGRWRLRVPLMQRWLRQRG